MKAIAPEQSVRLHKAGENEFSWADGVPMRILDRSYITPTLRRFKLLKLRADGFMTARSLTMNSPYSRLYKARIVRAYLNGLRFWITSNQER